MANLHKREIRATVGGVEYTLRPSFEALAEIEDRLGFSVLGLVRKCSEKRELNAKEMVTLIWAGHLGACGGKPDKGFSEFADELLDKGIAALAEPAMQFLLACIQGRKVLTPAPIDDQKKTSDNQA